MTKRIVLDTNQIVTAGVRWMDPMYENQGNDAVKLIKEVFANHKGLASSQIMGEYLEKLIDKNAKPELAAELIKRLWGAFEIIRPTLENCDPKPVDPDDLMFLLCALDGDADYLVSEDSDLLDLKDAYERPSILKRKEVLVSLLEKL